MPNRGRVADLVVILLWTQEKNAGRLALAGLCDLLAVGAPLLAFPPVTERIAALDVAFGARLAAARTTDDRERFRLVKRFEAEALGALRVGESHYELLALPLVPRGSTE